MMANMNYNQMLNFLASPNPHVGQISTHQEHFNSHASNQFRKPNCQQQMLQQAHSITNQLGQVQHYKIEENSPKQTRNRTKFTDEQIEKLEGANHFRILCKQFFLWIQFL